VLRLDASGIGGDPDPRTAFYRRVETTEPDAVSGRMPGADPPSDSADMEPHLCDLDSALGRERECPKDLCAFWSEDACVLTGLRADLASTPGLAELLFGLRERVGEPAEDGLDRILLPPGLR
jgi:hypothetical protein